MQDDRFSLPINALEAALRDAKATVTALEKLATLYYQTAQGHSKKLVVCRACRGSGKARSGGDAFFPEYARCQACAGTMFVIEDDVEPAREEG